MAQTQERPDRLPLIMRANVTTREVIDLGATIQKLTTVNAALVEALEAGYLYALQWDGVLRIKNQESGNADNDALGNRGGNRSHIPRCAGRFRITRSTRQAGTVMAEMRIDALRDRVAELEAALVVWKQIAEETYGQLRSAKYGYEKGYPIEGALDALFNKCLAILQPTGGKIE